MGAELRVCGIEPESIVDGPGIRYVIFVQGCPHHCPGCHNPQSHAFEGGTLQSTDALYANICQNPLLKGVTFSGGEPFCQAGPLAKLAELVHCRGLDVVTYTGFVFEELQKSDDPAVQRLLAETDLLIDGPFLLAERDLDLPFRGSRNQRLLDLRTTPL